MASCSTFAVVHAAVLAGLGFGGQQAANGERLCGNATDNYGSRPRKENKACKPCGVETVLLSPALVRTHHYACVIEPEITSATGSFQDENNPRT